MHLSPTGSSFGAGSSRYMTLSHAIKAGSHGRAECCLQMFDLTVTHHKTSITACCTLGAAYIGAFGVSDAIRIVDKFQSRNLETEAFQKAARAALAKRFPVLRDRHLAQQFAGRFNRTAHDLGGHDADLADVILALTDELSVKSSEIADQLMSLGL